MVRNTLMEEDGETRDQLKEAIFEPKMTRSKFKEHLEKGQVPVGIFGNTFSYVQCTSCYCGPAVAFVTEHRVNFFEVLSSFTLSLMRINIQFKSCLVRPVWFQTSGKLDLTLQRVIVISLMLISCFIFIDCHPNTLTEGSCRPQKGWI